MASGGFIPRARSERFRTWPRTQRQICLKNRLKWNVSKFFGASGGAAQAAEAKSVVFTLAMVYVKLASEIQLLKFQLNFSEISIADPELLEICKLEVRVVTL